MSTHDDSTEPVWARLDAFTEAPQGCGWMDPKGRLHPVDDFSALLGVIANDRSGEVLLVWSDTCSHLILPEELVGADADAAVRDGRQRRYDLRLGQSRARLLWGSLLLAGVGVQQLVSLWPTAAGSASGFERVGQLIGALLGSLPLGIALLLWFALVLMPWYQARKEMGEWKTTFSGDSKPLIPTLRFETWLMLQRASVTRVLAGCMILIWLIQWLGNRDAVTVAGLVKPAYYAGEYWRLLTGPWLHGNFLHFLFNLLALIYLGKRVELLARWPHLLTVLLFSMVAGGILSAHYLEASSVGISGGLLGLLGFLLIFETLHQRLVTRSARRRLLAGVLLTAAMGLIGYRFIDNAAHIGGLLAGMLYGVVVFPSSASIHRPRVLGIDRVAGAFAALGLAVGWVMALIRLL